MDEPLIVDFAIHHFDYIRGIFGLEPAKIRARTFNPSWSRFAGNATAFVEMEAANGAMISYTGSWDSRRPHTSWDGAWEIHGSHASMLWDYNEVTLFPHGNSIGETVFRVGALEREGDVLEIPLDPVVEEERWGTVREFVTAINEDRQPETHGADNLLSIGAVYAAVESAKQDGTEIDFQEYLSKERGA